MSDDLDQIVREHEEALAEIVRDWDADLERAADELDRMSDCVAGIDYSTYYVDVVTMPVEGTADMAIWHRLALRDDALPDDVQAFHTYRQARRVANLPWEDVTSVFIESPVPALRSMTTAIKLSRVQGAVMAAIPAHVEISECHPSEWKRILTGRPDASKAKVRSAAEGLGVEFGPEPPQDAYDAFGICWALRERTLQAMMAMTF